MQRFRTVDLLGPAALSIAVLLGVMVLRGIDAGATAHAGVPMDQSMSRTDGPRPGAGDPPSFLNAGSQRVEQLDVMREILAELKSIRKLLREGGARVRVESVELDYDRLADSVARVMPVSDSGSTSVEDRD